MEVRNLSSTIWDNFSQRIDYKNWHQNQNRNNIMFRKKTIYDWELFYTVCSVLNHHEKCNPFKNYLRCFTPNTEVKLLLEVFLTFLWLAWKIHHQAKLRWHWNFFSEKYRNERDSYNSQLKDATLNMCEGWPAGKLAGWGGWTMDGKNHFSRIRSYPISDRLTFKAKEIDKQKISWSGRSHKLVPQFLTSPRITSSCGPTIMKKSNLSWMTSSALGHIRDFQDETVNQSNRVSVCFWAQILNPDTVLANLKAWGLIETSPKSNLELIEI